MKPSRHLAILFLALGVAGATDTAIAASTTVPVALAARTIDLGATTAVDGNVSMSVTVALRLSDIAGAEALLQSVATPGGAQYHKFLSADEFEARFAPSAASVAQVVTALQSYGLSAERSTATTLHVSGTAAAMERAFSVSLHTFQVESDGIHGAFQYHAPQSSPVAPAAAANLISGVVGLDNRPHLHPHSRSIGSPTHVLPEHSTGNAPGSFTVQDFANYYDVEPLYRAGISGNGSKIGVMSLANFTPSDAFAYWNALGLHVNKNRLSVTYIDGGPGPISDADGSLETTLDVEQAGGIAPGANITVYLAPNTNQGFVDLFAAAIESNWADSLSLSWGEWEWFDNLENTPVTDAITGRTVSTLQAVHELLVRAALQGQTVFTSSADGGAYEAFDDGFGPPAFNLPLSVDYPASDPAITATGGTTLASEQSFTITGVSKPLVINIPHERVWGWDWLQPLCNALGTPDPIACGIFSGGSGGGVSVYFTTPSYQVGLQGVQLSQPRQTFIEYQPPPTTLLFALPAFYPGRNVPDVSMNADPYTGYQVYYTSSVTGFGIQSGWGGTSFVAPQLNGVTALLKQVVHGRIGLLNNALYHVQRRGGYFGQRAPLNPIPYGDNWFYQGSYGYNPAVGVGTMDVANFALALQALE